MQSSSLSTQVVSSVLKKQLETSEYQFWSKYLSCWNSLFIYVRLSDANGSGLWGCDREGVDTEEVGCNETWEGMGSTTLGGLEWHWVCGYLLIHQLSFFWFQHVFLFVFVDVGSAKLCIDYRNCPKHDTKPTNQIWFSVWDRILHVVVCVLKNIFNESGDHLGREGNVIWLFAKHIRCKQYFIFQINTLSNEEIFILHQINI